MADETTGSVMLTQAQLSRLIEGVGWERRETDERQRVQVPYDEGVANHIGPESCAGGREAAREALTGGHVGQPLSGERLHMRSADAIQSAEGHTYAMPGDRVFDIAKVSTVGHSWQSSHRQATFYELPFLLSKQAPDYPAVIRIHFPPEGAPQESLQSACCR